MEVPLLGCILLGCDLGLYHIRKTNPKPADLWHCLHMVFNDGSYHLSMFIYALIAINLLFPVL